MIEHITLGLTVNLHKKMVFTDNVNFQNWYSLVCYYVIFHYK